MATDNSPGVGQRRRLTIAGENYYLVGTRDDQGKITITVTTPDENKQANRGRRETAERMCQEITEMLGEI